MAAGESETPGLGAAQIYRVSSTYCAPPGARTERPGAERPQPRDTRAPAQGRSVKCPPAPQEVRRLFPAHLATHQPSASLTARQFADPPLPRGAPARHWPPPPSVTAGGSGGRTSPRWRLAGAEAAAGGGGWRRGRWR